MRDEIFLFFNELIENFSSIFKLIPINNKEINILNQYFPISIEANFIIQDKSKEYFIRLSPEYSLIQLKRNPFAMMTLVMDEKTCLKIINGKSTILREFNFGRIQVSNLKQTYMYRIILLGLIFEYKRKYENRLKIIKKIYPSIIKSFFEILMKNGVSTILNIIINKMSRIIVKILKII